MGGDIKGLARDCGRWSRAAVAVAAVVWTTWRLPRWRLGLEFKEEERDEEEGEWECEYCDWGGCWDCEWKVVGAWMASGEETDAMVPVLEPLRTPELKDAMEGWETEDAMVFVGDAGE
jgi:hypothetical protein